MTSHRKPLTHRRYLMPALCAATASVLTLCITLTASASTAQVAASDTVYASTQADTQAVDRLYLDETPVGAWDALGAAGYVGMVDDGCECLYVQPGTVIGGANGWVWAYEGTESVSWVAYPPAQVITSA